jgi:hypothetical protein
LRSSAGLGSIVGGAASAASRSRCATELQLARLHNIGRHDGTHSNSTAWGRKLTKNDSAQAAEGVARLSASHAF